MTEIKFPVPLTKWDAQVHRSRLVGMYDWDGKDKLILVVPQAHGSDKVHGIVINIGWNSHLIHEIEPLSIRGSIGAPNWHGYVWDGQLWEEEPPGYIAR